ncbi:DinB family protein [Spirosoma sp. BT702]|uniref:DinB family protein n=1 Tax=Spirosoma profusum TaxID=2771354 RepID=A0A926Y123_9BACT|nr:DinB family protein [Spirosoma profusum]MBD2703951.1 DinB family protein [Spirosoma profusum]
MTPTATELQHRLADECQQFIDVINSVPEHDFYLRPADKWSIADVTQHLYLSARPIVRLMTGPREVLRQWDSPDVASHTYQELRTNYENVLASGVKAPPTMSPRPEDTEVEKRELVKRFTGIYQALSEATDTWSEEELDTFCIPHPALGKLTVRDMLLFTCIHTQHHLRLLTIHV